MFSMYTDCAEWGEWRTGKQTAGLIVSASMFSLKFGSAVGGALPGFILAGVGFVANAVQTDASIFGIRLMFNLLPAAFFLVAGVNVVSAKPDFFTLPIFMHIGFVIDAILGDDLMADGTVFILGT